MEIIMKTVTLSQSVQNEIFDFMKMAGNYESRRNAVILLKEGYCVLDKRSTHDEIVDRNTWASQARQEHFRDNVIITLKEEMSEYWSEVPKEIGDYYSMAVSKQPEIDPTSLKWVSMHRYVTLTNGSSDEFDWHLFDAQESDTMTLSESYSQWCFFPDIYVAECLSKEALEVLYDTFK